MPGDGRDLLLRQSPTRSGFHPNYRFIKLVGWDTTGGSLSSMYGLIGQIECVPGKRAELGQILTATGKMPGCHLYVVADDEDDSDVIWVTEIWESKEAHQESLELPEVQVAIGRGRPLIAGFRSRHEIEPIGGIGLS